MKYVFDIMDKAGIEKGIREMLREGFRNAKFYDADPQQGGQRLPRSQSVAFQEMIKKLEEITGLPYIPTDDSEQMKLVRYDLYLKQLKEFIDRRRWNAGLITGNKEINAFQQLWLEEEKNNIARWKQETPKDRPENIVELNKYDVYITGVIKSLQATSSHDIYSHCTANEFKVDLSELCPKCPLIEYISTKIDEQIVFQANQQKEILTDIQFTEYCNAEITDAQKEMREASIYVQQDKDDPKFRSSRILSYIWNKERIKALNRVQAATTLENKLINDNIKPIEIEIPGFDDPPKLQRGVTSLVHQYQAAKGNPAPYKHPFFWHTKFRHYSSSPYVLEVNKDEVVTDENGKVIERKNVNLTNEDINEAFINYITTCHVNQIAPFLSFQFEKYYNGLRANESAQPFFDYVKYLADLANNRNLLYKAEADATITWILTNPYYKHETSSQPAPLEEVVFIDPEQNLSLRQIALLFIYQNKPLSRGDEANKVARQYQHQSGERLYKLYNKYSRTCDRTGVEGKAIKPLIKDIEKIMPYLNEQQRRQAQTEIQTINNKIQD
ncbi:hypothetical protein GCM10028807_34600 [Spirosoma daeguense]